MGLIAVVAPAVIAMWFHHQNTARRWASGQHGYPWVRFYCTHWRPRSERHTAGNPGGTFAAVPEIMGAPHLAGWGMAIVMFGQNLGMFVGPALFGALVERLSWAQADYCLIPICLLSFVVGWRVRVR